MDEQDIINEAYYILEQDNTLWDTTDDEYLTARGFLNLGLGRWEFYENTLWRELWTMLSDAASTVAPAATKVTVAATYDYDCPTDMAAPGGYVTTGGTTKTFWRVLPPEEVAKYANSDTYYCYFTGNREGGYDLHFNPRISQAGGETIEYPYYKKASTSDSASDVLELGDPHFLSYFIAAHMSEEGIDPDLMNMAEARLEQMRTRNMSGYFGVPDRIEDDLEGYLGFGGWNGSVVTSSNQTGR